jgi:antitoxin (DNA-binding transcriptional repressor) of toxin-antitoxin stability system
MRTVKRRQSKIAFDPFEMRLLSAKIESVDKRRYAIMTRTVDVAHPDAALDELVRLARNGTEVLFTLNNRLMARLVAEPDAPPMKRMAGLHAGCVEMSDDFDAPLPDEFWTGQA